MRQKQKQKVLAVPKTFGGRRQRGRTASRRERVLLQCWQSLEEGAGKQCSECTTHLNPTIPKGSFISAPPPAQSEQCQWAKRRLFFPRSLFDILPDWLAELTTSWSDRDWNSWDFRVLLKHVTFMSPIHRQLTDGISCYDYYTAASSSLGTMN